MKRFTYIMFSLVMVFALALSACKPGGSGEQQGGTTTSRKGGWLDEIVVSVIDAPSVLAQLKADNIDIYVNGFGTNNLAELNESGIPYSTSNGTYYTIQFNPAEFKAGFNPFQNRKIREAFNYIIDRNYINQEYYAGGALPKWFPIMTNFGDYADLADTARRLENEYAYNLDKAKEIIDAELEGMGVTIEDGKYMREGEPLKVVFLIRNDGDGTRKAWGNYLADQMEQIGFTVERQEGTGSDLGPIWIVGDPSDGEWHMYTGGWGASVLNRDQSNIFQEMYLNTSTQGLGVFQQNVSDPEFQELGDRLYRRDFKTMEERHDMMARALELCLQDSLQVMVADSKQFVPYREGVVATTDLAAGVESAQITPFTLRFKDQEGGTMRWATQSFLFNGPWNPIQGSNTTSDQGAARMSVSYALTYDPYTGLLNPFFAEKAAVTVQTGLPVRKTLDWVTLEFADKIVVPEDAWADWDAAKQEFITVGEKSGGEEVTARAKSVVTFRKDLFKNVKWHDGSTLEMADIIMSYIMSFDRAKEESAIFDKQATGLFEVFMEDFRGVKIVSTDPLTIEGYSNSFATDAELTADIGAIWLNHIQGQGSFSTFAMMNAAEAAGKLAYTEVKSKEKEIEQTSLIGGPSLAILGAELDKLIADGTIPYEATLGKYIDKKQATARYEALKAHYDTYGNYWQGTGAYFLKSVDLNGKSLVMAHFDQYPDYADRWSKYAAPMIAEVEIEGPAEVVGGQEAEFKVHVSFQGIPYKLTDISMVKFLVYDAANKVVKIDQAEGVEDGEYVIKFTGEDTKLFGAGASKIEVAVIPLVVAQPTFGTHEFITTQ